MLRKEFTGVRATRRQRLREERVVNGLVPGLCADAHQIRAGSDTFENPVSVGVGGAGNLALVELAVLVQIEPDGEPSQTSLAGILLAIAILVIEHGAAQQRRG